MRCFATQSLLSIGILTVLPALAWLALPVSPSRSQTPATNEPATNEPATKKPAAKPEQQSAPVALTLAPQATAAPVGELEADDASGLRQLVSEILLIRQRQGSLFQGTLLDAPETDGEAPSGSEKSGGQPKREFEQMLRQVAESQPPAPLLTSIPRSADVRSASRRFPAPVAAVHRASAGAGLEQLEDHLMQPQPPYLALLAAGQALDERAGLLEQHARFEAAERLRRLARRIRQEARQWAEATEYDRSGS